MSAADADDVWTLRCAVREELLAWIGRRHPSALPKIPTAIAASAEGDYRMTLSANGSSRDN